MGPSVDDLPVLAPVTMATLPVRSGMSLTLKRFFGGKNIPRIVKNFMIARATAGDENILLLQFHLSGLDLGD